MSAGLYSMAKSVHKCGTIWRRGNNRETYGCNTRFSGSGFGCCLVSGLGCKGFRVYGVGIRAESRVGFRVQGLGFED